MSGRKALTRCANCGNLREPAAMLRDRRTGEFHCVECDGAEYLAWRRSRRLGRASGNRFTAPREARPATVAAPARRFRNIDKDEMEQLLQDFWRSLNIDALSTATTAGNSGKDIDEAWED